MPVKPGEARLINNKLIRTRIKAGESLCAHQAPAIYPAFTWFT